MGCRAFYPSLLALSQCLLGLRPFGFSVQICQQNIVSGQQLDRYPVGALFVWPFTPPEFHPGTLPYETDDLQRVGQGMIGLTCEMNLETVTKLPGMFMEGGNKSHGPEGGTTKHSRPFLVVYPG